MIHCLIIATAIYCSVPLPKERPVAPRPAVTVIVTSEPFQEFP